jgi:carotenoid cleavage dioxygenase
MSKNLILGFVPWILYLIISSHNLFQFDIAILIALLASIFCQLHELKKGFILSWGTLVFFLFMTLSVVLFRNLWVIENAGFISNSYLPIIVLISIVIGKPFTMQYAKEKVPADKWKTPLFIRINYLLSSFWLCMFLTMFGIYLVRAYYPNVSSWFFNLLSYLPIILGTWISLWFPSWYKERYLNLKRRK